MSPHLWGGHVPLIGRRAGALAGAGGSAAAELPVAADFRWVATDGDHSSGIDEASGGPTLALQTGTLATEEAATPSGGPAVAFSDAVCDASAALGAERTFAFAFRNGPQSSDGFLLAETSDPTNGCVWRTTAGAWRARVGSSSMTSPVARDESGWTVIVVRYSGVVQDRLWELGQATTSNLPATSSATGVRVGGRFTSGTLYNMDLALADAAAYDSALSDADMDSVGQAMMDAYGIVA